MFGMLCVATVLSEAGCSVPFIAGVAFALTVVFETSQVKGVHDLFMAFMSAVMSSFFRETGARGQHNVPTEGPILFVCAPHANQFIDPVVVALHAGREVRFLAAAKSMRMRGFSVLANIMRSIPVERAQARGAVAPRHARCGGARGRCRYRQRPERQRHRPERGGECGRFGGQPDRSGARFGRGRRCSNARGSQRPGIPTR